MAEDWMAVYLPWPFVDHFFGVERGRIAKEVVVVLLSGSLVGGEWERAIAGFDGTAVGSVVVVLGTAVERGSG